MSQVRVWDGPSPAPCTWEPRKGIYLPGRTPQVNWAPVCNQSLTASADRPLTHPALQGKASCLLSHPHQGVPSFGFLLRPAIQSELRNYVLICISASYTELLHKHHSELHNLDQPELYKCRCFISIKVDRPLRDQGGEIPLSRQPSLCLGGVHFQFPPQAVLPGFANCSAE